MPVWLVIVLGVVGAIGTVVGIVASIVKGADKRLEEKVRLIVADCLDDVCTDMKRATIKMTRIEAKLDNGVLEAAQQHAKDIGRLSTQVQVLAVNMENLSKQLEAVLVDRR